MMRRGLDLHLAKSKIGNSGIQTLIGNGHKEDMQVALNTLMRKDKMTKCKTQNMRGIGNKQQDNFAQ
jgi:hypothetical protein